MAVSGTSTGVASAIQCLQLTLSIGSKSVQAMLNATNGHEENSGCSDGWFWLSGSARRDKLDQEVGSEAIDERFDLLGWGGGLPLSTVVAAGQEVRLNAADYTATILRHIVP